MESITIMLVDDHPLIQEGIVKILSLVPEFKVISIASTGKEAIEMCSIHKPNIMLLDINLPDISGIKVCQTIKKSHPDTRIIALTIHDQEEYIMAMIHHGVAAYLLKDVDPDQLIDTITLVASGKSFIPPALKTLVYSSIDQYNSKRIHERPHGLTERELDVLNLVASGHANKEIAKKLFISDKTVKNHLTSIFQKLRVSDRTQAALLAVKEKIVDN